MQKLEIPHTSRVWMNEKVKLTNLDKMQHSTQQKYNPIVQESFFYISQSDYDRLCTVVVNPLSPNSDQH